MLTSEEGTQEMAGRRTGLVRSRGRTSGGARSPSRGDALVARSRREADLWTRLGVAVLAVVPDCSGSTPGRRIGRDNAGGWPPGGGLGRAVVGFARRAGAGHAGG
jgi:hypothetical protein